MNETVKRMMIALKQTWGIGQRRFKNNFERRMKIYNSLVNGSRNMGMERGRKTGEATSKVY